MNAFRGSDEALDREIAAVKRLAQIRARRAAAELTDLRNDLRQLTRERARRKGELVVVGEVSEAPLVEG